MVAGTGHAETARRSLLLGVGGGGASAGPPEFLCCWAPRTHVVWGRFHQALWMHGREVRVVPRCWETV